MTAFCWKGLRLPARMVSLNVRASKMTDGRKNLSASSWLHCFRKLAGTMTRMRRFPSAQLWSIKSPASMVLPKPHFVGQDGTTGKRVAEGEECRFDLMRIEIDLGIRQDRRQLLNAVGSTTPRQFVGDVLGVVRRQLHGVTSTGCSRTPETRSCHRATWPIQVYLGVAFRWNLVMPVKHPTQAIERRSRFQLRFSVELAVPFCSSPSMHTDSHERQNGQFTFLDTFTEHPYLTNVAADGRWGSVGVVTAISDPSYREPRFHFSVGVPAITPPDRDQSRENG